MKIVKRTRAYKHVALLLIFALIVATIAMVGHQGIWLKSAGGTSQHVVTIIDVRVESIGTLRSPPDAAVTE